MAASLGKSLSSLKGIYYNNISLRFAKRCFPKFYSIYGPEFKDPILDRNEIEKLIKTKSREDLLTTKVKSAKSNITPCSVFYHPDVERLINCILRKGKRELAKTMVRDAFTKIKHIQIRKYNNETDENKKKEILISPLEVYLLALKNASPLLWYLKIKRSGSWYKIPTGISENQAKMRAIKWIIESAKELEQKASFKDKLASELLAASHYEGKTINKKIELHKMCESNRSYAHYWWT